MLQSVDTISDYLSEVAFNIERYRYAVAFSCEGYEHVNVNRVLDNLSRATKRNNLPILVERIKDSIVIKPKASNKRGVISLDGILGLEILRTIQGKNPEIPPHVRQAEIMEDIPKRKQKVIPEFPVVWLAMGRNISLDSGLL